MSDLATRADFETSKQKKPSLNSFFSTAFLLALQVPLFFIFENFGRDNEEYIRFFEQVGGDVNYLEPFWVAYAWAMELIGLGKPETLLNGMALLLMCFAFIFFLKAQKHTYDAPRLFLLVLTFASYEISFLTGALRHGVSFFLACIFLFEGRAPYGLISAATHWSGFLYTPFFLRNFKRAIFIIAPIALVSIIFAAIYFWDDLIFLGNLLNRLQDYQNYSSGEEKPRLLGLLISKSMIFFVFLLNHKVIRQYANSSLMAWLIISAPVLQFVPALFTNNMIAIDRGGMMLDPFVLIGTILIINKSGLQSLLLLTLIILPKFTARLLFAVI